MRIVVRILTIQTPYAEAYVFQTGKEIRLSLVSHEVALLATKNSKCRKDEYISIWKSWLR